MPRSCTACLMSHCCSGPAAALFAHRNHGVDQQHNSRSVYEPRTARLAQATAILRGRRRWRRRIHVERAL